MADVTVENCGSTFTFVCHTPVAREWVAANVGLESWQWFGPAFVVDHRYAGDLAAGMAGDGLEVE